MREFKTAAITADTKASNSFGKEVTFNIDGREVRFLPATEAQIALMVSAMMSEVDGQVATIINFFFSLLADKSDEMYFRRRLFDRNDGFNSESIASIAEALLEEWSGNPTQESSDSTS